MIGMKYLGRDGGRGEGGEIARKKRVYEIHSGKKKKKKKGFFGVRYGKRFVPNILKEGKKGGKNEGRKEGRMKG